MLMTSDFYQVKDQVFKSSWSISIRSDLLDQAFSSLKKSVDLASEKGASNWLTVLSCKEHGFTLHKTGSHDTIALSYGWDPARILQHYHCGTKFSIEHSFSCLMRFVT